MRSRNARHATAALLAAVAAGVLGVSVQSFAADRTPAQEGPPAQGRDGLEPRAQRPGPAPETISGTVVGFDFGPRGEVESVLIKDSSGTLMQLNFPPPSASAVQQNTHVGDSVTVVCARTRNQPEHPVYDLMSLNGAKGEKVEVGSPAQMRKGHVEGTVKHLNYDREGRADGAVLESGDFVLIGPEVEKLRLKDGDKVTADGPQQPMADGHTLTRAINVNGTEVRQPRGNRDGGPPDGTSRRGGPRQVGGRAAGDEGPPPGDRQPEPRERRGPAGPGGGPDADNDRDDEGPRPGRSGDNPPPPSRERGQRPDRGYRPPPPGSDDPNGGAPRPPGPPPDQDGGGAPDRR